MCMHAWTVLFFLRFILMGRFCLFSFIFQLPFYTLVFSEWGCFFSARWGWVGGYKGLSFPVKESPCYTNSLSWFVLLNSEKNEPRNAAAVIGPFGLSLRSPSGSAELAPLKHSSPFSLRLVSLAASPPDKGGIGDCCFCLYSNPLCFINPSVLRPPPLYFAVQNTGEECDTCLSLQFDVFSI